MGANDRLLPTKISRYCFFVTNRKKLNLADAFLTRIQENHPIHFKKMKKSFQEVPGMLTDLSLFFKKYEPFFRKAGLTDGDLCDAYLSLVQQMTDSRLYFKRNGKYPEYDHAKAVQNVYAHEALMVRYMLGLALSQFLWKHHYAVLSFFRERVAPHAHGVCLEVGAGHGIFLLETIENVSHCRVKEIDLVDISAGSLNLTKSVIAAVSLKSLELIHFIHSDIRAVALRRKYDLVVIGEVLEHVPDPDNVLGRLREVMHEDGMLYASTCANCPAIDHIFQFKSVQEIRKMFCSCGFEIQDEIVAPSEDLDESILESQEIDVSYAAVLRVAR